jgi:tRNA (mo5U34)-methyltransferase
LTSPGPSLTDREIRSRIEAVPHWYHQIEIRPGIVTPGINDSRGMLEHLRIPERCDGLRALDIGVRDGFFAFELERRGAEVMAIDYLEASETGFPVAKELLGSSVEYRVDNVYRLTPELHGEFDLVLFLGVLYHLRDPLLALDHVWDVCREGGRVILETQLLDEAFLQPDGSFARLDAGLRESALMQFYPGDSLRGDPTNYWAPNLACMRGLLETAGFDVEYAQVLGSRGVFHGRKVIDDVRVYHRRLEKSTMGEAVGPAPPAPAVTAAEPPAAALTGQPPEVRRLEHDLAIVRNQRAGLEVELEGARKQIASLEAALSGGGAARRRPPLRGLARRARALAARARRR